MYKKDSGAVALAHVIKLLSSLLCPANLVHGSSASNKRKKRIQLEDEPGGDV